MTDEQANNITREQAIRILHPDTSIEAVDDYEEAGNYEHAYDTACLMAVDALRGPQPDPDTGLVPCGCGCKPELRDDGWGWHQVYCTGCDMHGGNSHTPDGVIEEWNTAMGWKGGAE
jgi:hypothetical protein